MVTTCECHSAGEGYQRGVGHMDCIETLNESHLATQRMPGLVGEKE